ncbi:MAG: DUF4382 domain-containing protein [Myxococcaceae bacterium]|nr:MAG: DUF4382 domain-containing protein [Myxococcaceae bacterium]
MPFMLRSTTALLLTSALLCFTACGKDDPVRVSVKLAALPAQQIEKAVLTVSKVYLWPQERGSTEVVLRDAPLTVDLLALGNNPMALVKDVDVPPGTYGQLRLRASGGFVQLKEGSGSRVYATSSTYEGLPAGLQVDRMLNLANPNDAPWTVDFGEDVGEHLTLDEGEKTFLVDFDIARSFKTHDPLGNDPRLSPVMKGLEAGATSSLRVMIRLREGLSLPSLGEKQLGAASVILVNVGGGRTPKAVTATGEAGVFEATFRNLRPGEYTVELEGPDARHLLTDWASPESVYVGENREDTVRFTVTGHS